MILTITCGIQATSIVTMVMIVLHNINNMCSCNLPLNLPLSLRVQPLGERIHIRQTTPANGTFITYTNLPDVQDRLASYSYS